MEIQREMLVKISEELKSKGFNYLKFITAIDYNDHLEVIYSFYNISINKDEMVTIKLQTDKSGKNRPELDTIIKAYPSADWFERELSEMFDIKINGRKTSRLLLENWNGTDPPMRKSFVWGREYKKEI